MSQDQQDCHTGSQQGNKVLCPVLYLVIKSERQKKTDRKRKRGRLSVPCLAVNTVHIYGTRERERERDSEGKRRDRRARRERQTDSQAKERDGVKERKKEKRTAYVLFSFSPFFGATKEHPETEQYQIPGTFQLFIPRKANS